MVVESPSKSTLINNIGSYIKLEWMYFKKVILYRRLTYLNVRAEFNIYKYYVSMVSQFFLSLCNLTPSWPHTDWQYQYFNCAKLFMKLVDEAQQCFLHVQIFLLKPEGLVLCLFQGIMSPKQLSRSWQQQHMYAVMVIVNFFLPHALCLQLAAMLTMVTQCNKLRISG